MTTMTTDDRHGVGVSRRRLAGMAGLLTAISLAGGCQEVAEVDATAELTTSAEPGCRSTSGVLVVANASGRDIRRIRLTNLQRDPDMNLTVKQRAETFTRYEILWQHCEPRSAVGKRVLIDLADGQQYQGEMLLHPDADGWIFVTPGGIL
jgi:hypothetical protein